MDRWSSVTLQPTAPDVTDRFSICSLKQTTERKERPYIAPELYHAFKGKIQSLDNTATRLTLPEGTSPTTMKNHLLRVGVELRIPLTIRRVPGGLVFWRSSDEDIQQAQEKTASRLQTARRRQTRPRRASAAAIVYLAPVQPVARRLARD